MTYDEWADEYLTSAKVTKEKIREIKQKKKKCKNTQLLYFYAGKLRNLYEMYNDCMDTANELRRKANRLRERGTEKLVMV